MLHQVLAHGPRWGACYKVLDEQLRCLGATVGRDFLGEIRGAVEGGPALADGVGVEPGS